MRVDGVREDIGPSYINFDGGKAEDIEESNDIPIPVEKTQLVSLLTFLLP